MINRVGVFGGMFDPVHRAHIQAALYGLELLKLDLLKMVPCHIPNHRPGAFASGQDRLNMLGLATEKYSALEVDTIELDRDSVSYMVDTVAEIAGRYKSASVVLIIGLDSFNSLPTWNRFSEMSKLCHLLVLSRSGALVKKQSKSQVGRHWMQIDNPKEMFGSKQGNYHMVENFDFDISSTAVREAIHKGQLLTELVDESVAGYIESKNLYSS